MQAVARKLQEPVRSDAKGEAKRPKREASVPMQSTGADRLVLARKARNGAGAKGFGSGASHARSNWKQEDLDACDRRAVWSACLPDGSRVRRESHARFCERRW